MATSYIKKKGWRILARQFSTRVGEIDLIAKDGDEIVFIEVKTRRTADFGHPEESVTGQKLEKIMKTGIIFLQQKKLENEKYRIDVIAIEGNIGKEEIVHLQGVG